jgi:hypothetical protein
MASFKITRGILLESYDEGVIDEDKFLLLFDLHRSTNPEFPYKHIAEFNLEDMDEFECMAEFRCQKSDIETLGELLRLPQRFICPQGSVCIVGLCICLKRLAYPCPNSDLIHRFGKPPPVLSMIHNEVVQFTYREHGHRVTRWNHSILSPANLQNYADAVHGKGGALENCFGFIRPICHPKKLQRTMHNGHKRLHAMKFQSVSLPNGLIAHLYGPVGMTECTHTDTLHLKLHYYLCK